MSRHKTNVAIVITIVFLMLLPIVANPALLRVASLFFLTMVALTGLHIVTGLTKIISLCHAAFIGLGAYGSAIVSLRLGLPPIIGLFVGMATAACCAFLLACLTTRLEDHYLALATLAFGEMMANIFRGATPITGGANGLSGVPPLRVLGLMLDTPVRYYPFCLVIGVASLLFVRRLDRGSMGRALRAMGDEGILIETLGISASRLRAIGFIFGGALAGLAGAVAGHIDGFVGPETYSVSLSIAYLCYLIVGGLGRIEGVILGAALASLGPELFRGFFAWQMVIIAALSLGLLLFQPLRKNHGAAAGFAWLSERLVERRKA